MENEKANQATQEVAPDQKVIIVGCVNPTLIEAVKQIAAKEDAEIVMLEPKVISDYLHVKDAKNNKTAEQVTLEQFLANESNRVIAQEQAHKLHAILNKNTAIEDESVEYSEVEVCRLTTLSHSRANNLFNLLRAFGFFEWKDMKRRTFVLHFNDAYKIKAIENDILSVANAINSDIVRYKNAIASVKDSDDSKVKDQMEELKKTVLETLNF